MAKIFTSLDSISLSGNKRLGLWALLSVLTLLIFLYPAQLQNESHPIESIYVFDHLPIFAVLYFVWFAVLLVLVLSHGGERTDTLEKVILLCIFTLVFAGIWVSLRQSFAGEASREASNILYINNNGFLPQTGNTYILEFPGVAILGSTISQITGLTDFTVLTFLQLLYIILFPTILYLTFRAIIGDSRWATLGVLLAITGSIMLAKQLSHFHPSSFAIFFLLSPFLLILIRSKGINFGGVAYKLVFLVLMLAVTVTHLITSYNFFFILFGILLFQMLGKKGLVTSNIVLLCAVLILSWGMFNAPSFFEGLTRLIPRMIEDLRQGQFVSGYAAGLAGAYAGEGTPMWANITRYFWLILLFVSGAVIAIRNLFVSRGLADNETKITGGLFGIAFIAVITLILSGMEEFSRTMVYAPFYAVPLVVLLLYKYGNPLRKYGFILLTLALLILSFPTFLAHNNTVGTTAYYPYESSGYQLLREKRGDKELYYGGGWAPVGYYLEGARGVGASLQFVEDKSITGMLDERLERIDRLEERSIDSNSFYFYELNRETQQFEHLLGFNPVNTPEWQKFLFRLNQKNRIFDNGYTQFYQIE